MLYFHCEKKYLIITFGEIMKKVTMILTVLTMVLTLATAMVANATLIAYEPFDYTPTNSIDGLNGGDGWGESWQGIPGGTREPCSVTAPGMNYTSGDALYVKGNKCVANSSNYWDYSSRNFSAPLNSVAGSTNWFSFICSLQADTNSFGQYIIGFRKSGDDSNIRFIANGLGWNTWALNKGGDADYFSSTPFVSNETLFVVIEKVNLVNSTQDYWTAWINPPVNQHPTNYTGAFGGVYPAGAISGVHIQKSGPDPKRYFKGYVDEFRIGENWDDVNTDEPILVHTPLNQAPTNFESGVSLTPTLAASIFASDDVADAHSASIFHVESIDGVVALDTNVGGVVSFTLPSGLLEENTRYFWTVSYKGSHSAKWSAASVLTYFSTIYTTEPMPLAYEGVTYDVTASGINGYSGGEGWRGSWTSLEGWNFWISQQDVVSPGLAYRLLEVTNNAIIARNQIKPGSTNGYSKVERKIQRDGAASLLNQNNNFGGPNMTTWISGLIEAPVGMEVEKNQYFVYLESETGIKLSLGKSKNSKYWSVNYTESDVEVVPGQPAFLVAKVVYTLSNSVASLWIDPNIAEDPGSNFVAVTSTKNSSDYGYNKIQLMVGRDLWGTNAQGEVISENSMLPEVKFDEIRVGTTWQQVLPGKKSVIPVTPSNIAPADAEANVAVDGSASFQGSAYSATSGGMSISEFQIESLGGVVTIITSASETVTIDAGALQQDTLYFWKVRYYSDISGLASVWSLTTTFSTVWIPRDTPIVYDGADYSAMTQVEGLNGGYGWADTWDVKDFYYTNLPVDIETTTPGLIFDSLPVVGNSFLMNEDSLLTNTSFIYAMRRMKTIDGVYHMTKDGSFGKAGSTNWLSFLAKVGADTADNPFYVGASPNIWGISIGARGRYLPAEDIVEWSVNGVSQETLTKEVKTNEAAFIVLRFIASSDIETNGTAHLWINPTLSEIPPTVNDAASLSTNGFGPFDFDGINVRSTLAVLSTSTNIVGSVTNIYMTYRAPKVNYDEIRFGDSWLGVTGVPEPVGLWIIGLLELWIIVKRQASNV